MHQATCPNGEIWRSRIVVGQPYRSTRVLRSEITHLTVNPTLDSATRLLSGRLVAKKIRDDIATIDRRL